MTAEKLCDVAFLQSVGRVPWRVCLLPDGLGGARKTACTAPSPDGIPFSRGHEPRRLSP